MEKLKNTVFKKIWLNALEAKEQQKEITVLMLNINVGKAKARPKFTWDKSRSKQ